MPYLLACLLASCCALGACALGAAPAAAQSLPADTLLTWRTYGEDGVARVRIFRSIDEDRPQTVVVDELAENGSLVTDDVRFFAETVGRAYGYDPAETFYVFRFSGESFCESGGRSKTLLLRATFTRTRTGRLSTPTWRVITRDELAELTDRALY